MSDSLGVVRRDLEGGVAVLELDRPDALNAFTLGMARELLRQLEAVEEDDDARVVVLTGRGRAFSAGADVKDVSAAERGTVASGRPDLGYALREVYNPLVLRLREMRQPVVSAVNGVAAGIGCSIALASDFVVAERSSSFMLAFVRVALVPDGGSSLLASVRAGVGRATEMAMLGDRVPATRALEIGLANELAEDGEGLTDALTVAARLAAGPPEALCAIKALLNAPLLEPLKAQLAREAAAQTGRSDSAEVAEAMAAFREKRQPVFASATPVT